MADGFNNETLNKLLNFFGFNFQKSAEKPEDQLYPVKKSRDTEGNAKLEKLPFNDETKELFKWWMSDCHDNKESWSNREALWQDMDLLYYNCQIISKAIEITADEVIQADSNDQIIFVEGKAKIKKFIYELFDKININHYIRPTIVQMIKYGNAGWVLGFDKSGVSEIIPVDVYSIKDRLEFTPFKVQEKLKNDQMFKKYATYDRIQQLIDSILNKDNISAYFKKYLFGFEIADTVIPPWKFLHFRNMSFDSPFDPFGMPVYIHAMSAYRQYDAAMSLQQAARGARFPKEIFKLIIPNSVASVDKLNKALEFLNEYQNSGLGTSKKETPGIGEVRVTIQDLYEYAVENVDIDLGKIDDIQMLKDDIINSTMLPRNLLDPNDSAFGDSGVSLVEKQKPFARFVYRFQTQFLQQVSQLIKIHAIFSGQFEEDELDFILSMKYPESQTSSDIVSSQGGLLGLANDIIAGIQDKITGGNPLPPELVKSIYTQFLPYDAAKVEQWIDDAIKSKEETDEQAPEDMEPMQGEDKPSVDGTLSEEPQVDLDNPDEIEDALSGMQSAIQESKISSKYNYWRKLQESVGKKKLEEQVQSIIMEERQRFLRDYSLNKRHYYSSKNNDPSFKAEQLYDFDKQRIKKLAEKINKEDYEKQYIEEYKIEKSEPIEN